MRNRKLSSGTTWGGSAKQDGDAYALKTPYKSELVDKDDMVDHFDSEFLDGYYYSDMFDCDELFPEF
jgi:hypothetical protein